VAHCAYCPGSLRVASVRRRMSAGMLDERLAHGAFRGGRHAHDTRGDLGGAHALESIVPPCLLYLGVSEPGQFKTFMDLTSREWLAVSALDQGNPEVRGDNEHWSSPLLTFLLPDRVRGIPLSVLFQRRRLESVRTNDDVWESQIRHLIAYVPLIVADLRSHSTIISNEFSWVLQAGMSRKLLVLTRDDGATSLTPLLLAARLDLARVARATTTSDTFNHLIFTLLDSKGYRTTDESRSPEELTTFGLKLAV
jgi:hypothetical protein